MVDNVMDDKKPFGRPSKYDPKYCQMIIDFMKDGKSLTAFAGEIEVNKDTIYEWEKKHPDFTDAINAARNKCAAWWEKQGRDGLFMGHQQGSFSQSVWIFNMKARFGYRDKVESEVTHKGNITLGYALDKEPEE